MTALPPGPFTYVNIGPADKPMGHGHVYLRDANGRNIGVCWGRPEEKIALAEMICTAREKVAPK